MEYWLELSSTIRQWADVIGLTVFVVGVRRNIYCRCVCLGAE